MSQLTHGLTHEDRHEQDGTDTHRKELRLCGSVVLFYISVTSLTLLSLSLNTMI